MSGIYEGCRVCGYNDIEMWREGKYATYYICPSCFTESGYDDLNYEIILKRRTEWIAEGMPWRSSTEPTPQPWDKLKQLENIPDDYR